MGAKFQIVKERVKQVALVGKTWRLVSMVRQRIITRSEMIRRARAEREAKQRATREINARIVKTL